MVVSWGVRHKRQAGRFYSSLTQLFGRLLARRSVRPAD
jgi:hypothetical protein